MRRVLIVVLLVAGACTGGDDDAGPSTTTGSTTPTTSTPATLATEPPATDSSATVPTDSATSVPGDEDELPVLEDIVYPPYEPATRTAEILLDIAERGEPSLQNAVDAFGLLDPSMPGTTPSDLPPGDGLDGTAVWAMVDEFRDRLAPEQLEVIDSYRQDDVVVATITGDEVELEPTPTTQGFRLPRQVPPIPPATIQHFSDLLNRTLRLWRAHRPDFAFQNTIQLVFSPTPLPRGGGMDADASAAPTGPSSVCTIRVGSDFYSANFPDDEITWIYAHELFHCVQFTWYRTIGLGPFWLTEGGANWAASDLLRNVLNPPIGRLRTNWFTDQGTPLAARSYDAWPFFENLQLNAREPYQVMKTMLTSGAPGNVDAALAAARADELLFRMKWSSRALRSQLWEPATWFLPFPAPNPSAGPLRNATRLGERGIGTYEIVGAPDWAHPQQAVLMANDVGLVTVTPTRGALTTHAISGTVYVPEMASRRLCYSPDGCVCPDGTSSGAERMDGRGLFVSLSAGKDVPAVSVRAQKWDPRKECKRPEQQRRRGSSNGDPHLTTFDGLAYDFMSLGEFVNARDPEGGFEVQTRNEAVTGFPASLSTAVALGTTDHRITFTADGIETGNIVVRVDGLEVDPADTTVGDMDVAIAGDDVVATWPDGSSVELAWNAGWFVTVTASAERGERLQGVLGSSDDDFTNDLQLADGTVLDPHAVALDETEFADAWAVDEETTLFDYETGESPATFRKEQQSILDLVLDDDATAQCEEALGEDAASHEIESCAFDVTATGNTVYVDAYETVVEERVEAQESEGETVVVEETPTAPGTGVPTQGGEPTLVLSGTLAAPYADDFGPDTVSSLNGSIDAAEGTVLLARTELCLPDVTVWITVANMDAQEQSITTICDPAGWNSAQADEDDEVVNGEIYIWLSGAGTHQVLIETDAEEASFVEVELFADPSPTIVTAEELSDGDEVTLEGIGDTVVYQQGLSDESYGAVGFDAACAVIAYGAEDVGNGAPWPLGYCAHETSLTVGNAFAPVPVVVFARTEEPVDITLTPQ